MQRMTGARRGAMSGLPSADATEIDATPTAATPVPEAAVKAAVPQAPPSRKRQRFDRAEARRAGPASLSGRAVASASASGAAHRAIVVEQSLRHWLDQAGWPEVESRLEVAERVRAVLRNQGESLSVFGMELTALPGCLHLLTTLRHFDASGNSIAALPQLPPSLTSLKLMANQLADVGRLPPGLIDLDLCMNSIVAIRDLPPTLKIFDASYNLLTSLPTLPAALQVMRINDNQITQLPALPPGLSMLTAHGNHLTQLPTLPESLGYISVRNNPMMMLPAVPARLNTLHVDESVLCATRRHLEERIAALRSGFDPQLQVRANAVAVASASKITAVTPARTSGFGDLDALPADVLVKIARDFEPGSTDAARLAGASKALHALLTPRLSVDREIALARGQLDILEDFR